jgi:hypothetical protein
VQGRSEDLRAPGRRARCRGAPRIAAAGGDELLHQTPDRPRHHLLAAVAR